MKYFRIFLFAITFLFSANHVYASPETDLYLSPATKATAQDNSFTTAVMVNSGTNLVLSGDIVVKFNPAVLNAVSTSKGDFFTTMNVVQNKIDNTAGTVTYSFYTTSSNAKAGTGKLLTIKWKGVGVGTDNVTFDTSRTLIYSSGEGSSLRATTGGTYTIRPRLTPTTSTISTQPPSPTISNCDPNFTGGSSFVIDPSDLENPKTETEVKPQGFIERTLVHAGVCSATTVNGSSVTNSNNVFPFVLGAAAGSVVSFASVRIVPSLRSKFFTTNNKK